MLRSRQPPAACSSPWSLGSDFSKEAGETSRVQTSRPRPSPLADDNCLWCRDLPGLDGTSMDFMLDEGMIHEVGKHYWSLSTAGIISKMDHPNVKGPSEISQSRILCLSLPHKDGAGVGTTVPNEESLDIRISPALTVSINLGADSNSYQGPLLPG